MAAVATRCNKNAGGCNLQMENHIVLAESNQLISKKQQGLLLLIQFFFNDKLADVSVGQFVCLCDLLPASVKKQTPDRHNREL